MWLVRVANDLHYSRGCYVFAANSAYQERSDMGNSLKHLWQDEQGQDLVEYSLLLVLIALVSAATIRTLGTSVKSVFGNASTALSGYAT